MSLCQGWLKFSLKLNLRYLILRILRNNRLIIWQHCSLVKKKQYYHGGAKEMLKCQFSTCSVGIYKGYNYIIVLEPSYKGREDWDLEFVNCNRNSRLFVLLSSHSLVFDQEVFYRQHITLVFVLDNRDPSITVCMSEEFEDDVWSKLLSLT